MNETLRALWAAAASEHAVALWQVVVGLVAAMFTGALMERHGDEIAAALDDFGRRLRRWGTG